MAEYIERAALMEKLTTKEVQSAMREMNGSQAYSFFLALINNEPAADVVAVVRCKDCVHFADAYGKDSGKPCGYGQCKSISGVRWIVCADDYCSSGERRSDDG